MVPVASRPRPALPSLQSMSPNAVMQEPGSKERWAQGLPQEMDFWSGWIRTRGLDWKADFEKALTPGRPLAQVFINHLKTPPGGTVHLLDVGSGPLSVLAGVQWNDRTIKTTAIDPLADDYNRALANAGVIPLLPVLKGEAESLTSLFAPSTFDLVHASNCIDHSYDPVLAIRQMVEVVKPGCFVLLEHAVNEAEKNAYQGLHQWNFGVDECGSLRVWRPGFSRNIEDALEDIARVSSTVFERPGGNWLSVRIRKLIPQPRSLLGFLKSRP